MTTMKSNARFVVKKTLLGTMTLAAFLGLTACSDDDNSSTSAPPLIKTNYHTVTFKPVGGYTHGQFAESASEINAFHPASKRSFVVNAQNGKVDVLDMSDVTKPKFVKSLDASDLGGAVNSVAIHGNFMALAVQAKVKTDKGFVAFYDANTLERISVAQVGALPDMLTFSPDSKYVLVANEGEPDDDYVVDPEGSVSVINIMDIKRPLVKNATFNQFNAQEAMLKQAGVRIFGKRADGANSTVAQDLEPEYIALTEDGKKAFVSLQENNAIAVIDVATATVTNIYALGAKDHSKPGNGLDVSNKDDAINIKNWPIFGMYQPDAVATYTVNGKTYLITANEGDAREWGNFKEEVSFADVTVDTRLYNTAACYGIACDDKKALGKIDFTAASGDANNDGIYEKLYSFGARSFSIWDTSNMSQPVYDSGDFMAQFTAKKYPNNFNASNDNNGFDDRSDNKGVEPEGVVLGKVGSQTIAFVGLERISSVMAFDVTDPSAVKFLGEINTRTFNDVKLDAAKNGTASPDADGDLGPEGLTFVSAKDSPNGKPLLIVGYEVSGTTRVFELTFIQ